MKIDAVVHWGGFGLKDFSDEMKSDLPNYFQHLREEDFPIDMPCFFFDSFFEKFDVMVGHAQPKTQTKKERKSKKPIEYERTILYLDNKGNRFRT